MPKRKKCGIRNTILTHLKRLKKKAKKMCKKANKEYCKKHTFEYDIKKEQVVIHIQKA